VCVPRKPAHDTFSWLSGETDILQGATWYIDGSLFDEDRKFARRTGYGVAVVTTSGKLIAYGHGIPPAWIHDAAGAELWAFYAVLSMNSEVPRIVTDCLGILETLRGPTHNAVLPTKMLARTWGMILSTLDGRFEVARHQTVWMPSHLSTAAIGSVKDSEGKPITNIMWRANRLVDVLAKKAAGNERLPKWVVCKAANAAKLVQHHAARLGYVTHEANNHKVQVACSSTGELVTTVARDSLGMRPIQQRRRYRRPECQAKDVQQHTLESARPCGVAASCAPEAASAPYHCKHRRPHAAARHADAYRSRKRAASVHIANLHEEAADEERVARWIEGLQLKPARDTLSSQDRFESLRERVRKRQLEARWPEE
jgi:hypothetical protein